MVKALRAKLCSVSKKSCSLGYDVGSKALRASWYFVIEGGELHRNQDLDHTISCSLGYDVGSLRLVGSISISGLYIFHCRFHDRFNTGLIGASEHRRRHGIWKQADGASASGAPCC